MSADRTARVRAAPHLLALSLVPSLGSAMSIGCDRGVGDAARTVAVRGFPACPKNAAYERPLVVRLDRDRSLFEEPFQTHARVDAPAPIVSLVVPRERMHATVRVGTCQPTSLATWDCAAATWLASTDVDLDARGGAFDVALPAFEAACGRPGPR